MSPDLLAKIIVIAIILLCRFPVHEFRHALGGVPSSATGRPSCSGD